MLQGQLNGAALAPSSNASSRNLVKIWNNVFVANGIDDAQSAVLTVAPSFNASLIGAGPTGAPLQPLFGNTDFKAYNIDFQNRAVSDTHILTNSSQAQLRKRPASSVVKKTR